MAKYEEVYEDTKELVDAAFQKSNLHVLMNMRVLRVEKQKEVIKVAKAGDMVRFLNGIDVFMFIHEDLFDRLEAESKNILIEEAIARIKFDVEKEKLTIDKGDVHTPSLLLKKHGFNKYEAMMMNISQVAETLKEENKK
jgi:hypothetical protein